MSALQLVEGLAPSTPRLQGTPPRLGFARIPRQFRLRLLGQLALPCLLAHRVGEGQFAHVYVVALEALDGEEPLFRLGAGGDELAHVGQL